MMQRLLRELPESFTVGFFYDVICALHREMERPSVATVAPLSAASKFATPVFHSYGHQWPCQLSYHPYKNPEFGRTDGEGCEREWNLLNGVIPTCRISGFYRRLFVINTKQAYIDGQNLRKLASRQKRRFDDAVAKLDEAEGALDRLGIPIDEIQTAWAEQLSTQQAEPPLPEKDAGMKTIESILNLLRTRTTLRRQITLTSSQQASILLHDPSSPDCVELLDRLDQLRSSLERVESQLAKKEYDLLLHGKMTRGDLEKIKSSQWYDALVRARAHYQRLVAALIGRKFTITQCIEDYRSHILDHKARIHEAKADKKRQPAAVRCLDQLNKEIERMLDAWDDAPRGAIRPEKLDRKGLFSLDID
ncbi:hypothetical protein BS47DRAFT_1394479, partial [Hydnum rufescens UP504]